MPQWPDGIVSRADFAAALTALRESAGLTVRELARRVDTPPATLGGYFSGRHVPSTAQLPLLRRLLAECGVTGEDDVERWVAALARARGASDRRLARPPAPYRGLNSFEPADADVFFGRDDEVADILARLAALRADPGPSGGILAVIGPSGSGKSSLLRAGVVVAVRAGRLPGAELPATCVVTTPGPDPLAALDDALGAEPGVLVIDQFEEIFTSAPDAGARAEFLRRLADRDPRALVVLGMRADFYAAAAREPAVLPALQHAQVLVAPLTQEHLRDVIVRPAQQVGATVDDGLVDLITADLAPHDAAGYAHDAGALPLLSHALLATWERGAGTQLTIADYRAAGGIDGAVQRTAENLFETLSECEQELARRVFLRLVNLDDDVAVTRRRGSWAELRRIDAGAGADVAAVIGRFVERRLLTAHANAVEITHEALLSAWPRLRGWVDLDRAGLRLQRQITDAANAWQDAGRDPALLLRGGRLEAAAEWAADENRRDELNRVEREFVESSIATAAAERARERRRSRGLKQLLAVVAVLALVAGALAVYALHAQSVANRDRRAAASARDDALSRQLAIQSRQLTAADPALAQQLALAGYRIAATMEARSALIDASAAPTITRVLGAPGPTPLAVSHDGRTVAVGHADNGSVHLYTLSGDRAPRPLAVLPGGAAAQVFALAFGPDDHLLATGGQSTRVQLWDLSTPAHPRAVATLGPAFHGAIQAIAISPDGHTLAASSAGPSAVQEWDITDPAAPRARPAPSGLDPKAVIQSVAFSPDGRQLAAGGSDGAVHVWPLTATGTGATRSVVIGATTVDVVRFDRTGARVLAGDRTGVVSVLSAGGVRPRVLRTLPGGSDSQINTIDLSPDGRRLATGSSDNTVRQWDTGTWKVLSTTEHPGPVTGVAYSPDGRDLFTTAADGTLRRWPAAARLVPIESGSVFNVSYSADGARLAVATNGAGGAVRLWDLRDPAQPRALGPAMPMVGGKSPIDGTCALTPDGNLLAAGNSNGEVQLWDVHEPAQPRRLGRPFAASSALVESLTFSADGHTLALASDDNTVRLWDVRTPTQPAARATVRGGNLMLNVAISGDGRLLAGASADNHAYLWRLDGPATPRLVARLGGFASYVYGVAFSHDGRTLAATSSDHTTRLWDVSGAKPVVLGPALRGPTDYAYSAAFSPDDRLLAVASNDRSVWLYDTSDRRHPVTRAQLRGLGSNVFSVAFSPDGRTLVGGGRAATLAVWTVDPELYAASMCGAAGSAITRTEWAQYVPGARYQPPCA